MRSLQTEIVINASPQTVWSIMDDLARYPEWNPIVPELAGLTIKGQALNGQFSVSGMTSTPLTPTLLRVVAARELRWVSVIPGENGFSAEHYFILTPTKDGGTHLVHNEDFDGGQMVEMMWPGLEAGVRPAYLHFNEVLKARAEAFEAEQPALHPAVDKGVANGSGAAGATLRCYCESDPVEVRLEAEILHNHLCGCSKCWKPDGALFAQTAVVAAGTLQVAANEDKLAVVDAAQSIRRHACKACGVHMFGRVDDERHHFFGVDFIHPELAVGGDGPTPEFAGFVSSLIETGGSPSQMKAIRRRLGDLGVAAYDAFSPELMDVIAWHRVKISNHDRSI